MINNDCVLILIFLVYLWFLLWLIRTEQGAWTNYEWKIHFNEWRRHCPLSKLFIDVYSFDRFVRIRLYIRDLLVRDWIETAFSQSAVSLIFIILNNPLIIEKIRIIRIMRKY